MKVGSVRSARDALLAAMEESGRRGRASDADLGLMQAFALMHVGDQLGRIADALAFPRGGEGR